eukprot:TRINITY_DN9503_c0_g1_i1.p3 TRINITY_DN9503_c0_g1~~TRINITY_DN9503_c0_g1_i1.p3  ORF type:complete len:199 (-),score=18.17 TRINITY_DN9503_c0_g1_i1:374-970(-)
MAHDAIANCTSITNSYSCLDYNYCEVCSDGRCLFSRSLTSLLWTVPDQQTKSIASKVLICGLDQNVLAGFLFQNVQDREKFVQLMSCSKIADERTCVTQDVNSNHIKDVRAEEISVKLWNEINEQKERQWRKIEKLVLAVTKNGDMLGNYEDAAISTFKKHWVQFTQRVLNFPSCRNTQTHRNKDLKSDYHDDAHDEL